MQQIAAALLVSGDGGGVSRPVKSVCFCGERPRSAPMYAPESSVPAEIPVAPTRGRTTQKRVSRFANRAASRVS